MTTSNTCTVLRPGDPGFDTAVTGFQTDHPHRPDLVVRATTAGDVARAVRHAADRGLPLAVQSTGHGRADALDGGVLIDTAGLRTVTVDPATRTARIAAGARWSDVAPAAAAHGLAPVSGSSPGVGVVGYLLGGGFGLLGRRYGYALDGVRAVRSVAPDGTITRSPGFVDDHVVTEVELGLAALPEVWGGSLAVEATPDVLAGYAAWTADLPDELTTSIALVPFPDRPEMPPPFRGRHVAMVRVAAPGEAAERAARLTGSVRDLGPVLTERFGAMPAADAHTIYADPTDPHGYAGDAWLLRRADRDALRRIPELTGPEAQTPSVVELRHLGGAFSGPRADGTDTDHTDTDHTDTDSTDTGGTDAVTGRLGAAHRDAGYLLRAITGTEPAGERAARAAHRELRSLIAGDELGRAWTFAYGLPRHR